MTATDDHTDPLVRLHPAAVVADEGGRLTVTSPIGSFAVGPEPGLSAALRSLTGGRGTVDDLPEAVRDQVYELASQLPELFVRGVRAPGGPLVATVERTGRNGAGYRPEPPSGTPVRLSRFAMLRTMDDETVLESPLSGVRVRFTHPDALALAARLGSPTDPHGPAGSLRRADVVHLVGHLLGSGMAEPAGPHGAVSDTDPTLRQWEFHDLLLHTRSRFGRYDQPFGATLGHRGEIEPQPALKPVPDGPATALPRPQVDELLAGDVSLTTALEARRSVRSYGTRPLDLAQLGEFLYRTARVRATYGPTAAAPYEASTRPYPSGGAGYELELYLTVHTCTDLEPGAYYYDPAGHRLVLLGCTEEDRNTMLRVASVAAALRSEPQVLVTVTSRFQRLSWKYRAIAYSVGLMHVGVLYQTMYLVATAMGLAPCGIGSGDADLAARAFGLDRLREAGVGDFLIGSAPADDPAGQPPENWQAGNDPGWSTRALAEIRAGVRDRPSPPW